MKGKIINHNPFLLNQLLFWYGDGIYDGVSFF